MSNIDTSREPCPDRIIDDVGGAFGMGSVGGAAFHFLKGTYNSPKGSRFAGGTQSVRMNAPRIGGSFAVWGGLFSTFDCSMVYLRQKEDPWNSIISGAAAGGFLSMRQGLVASSKAAVLGGVLLALIEGAGIMINKVNTPQQQQVVFVDEPMPAGMGGPGEANETAISPASWLGGLFGGDKKEVGGIANETDTPAVYSPTSWLGGLFGGDKQEGGGAKTEVLENMESPVPPSFEYN